GGDMGSVTDRLRPASAAAALPRVTWFDACGADSIALVGGKCASLGELIGAGVNVPPGFALTTEGTRAFLREAGIDEEIATIAAGVDAADTDAVEAASARIRSLIEAQPFSAALEDEI